MVVPCCFNAAFVALEERSNGTTDLWTRSSSTWTNWTNWLSHIYIYISLRIQICPKKGICSIFLFWGWDWDDQSYSREGSGFLGYIYIYLYISIYIYLYISIYKYKYIFWGHPQPTNSGVREGLVWGPFIKMNKLLFHWHRGWEIPPIYVYIYINIIPINQITRSRVPERPRGFSAFWNLPFCGICNPYSILRWWS